tara:strand:- start:2163 stop:2990 length:828 start_codon:yes stop_codon:yes gene_type:complete
MVMRRTAIFILLGLTALAGLALWKGLAWREAGMAGRNGRMPMTAADRPEICEEKTFEGARAILCVIDPAAYEIRLAYRDGEGRPHGSVKQAVAALEAEGRTPVLAMNAGMYHSDMLPVGLYVEDGAELSALATGGGFGNFFLKPNGVFFIRDNGTAWVMETEAYQRAGIAPRHATQSGPMLVIDGDIHPRFLPDGTTRYIRNGVGVRKDGAVVLAITREEVSLGSFGRLFRDVANCPNALFFDGAVSSLAWGAEMEIDSGEPAGPIVAVFSKPVD